MAPPTSAAAPIITAFCVTRGMPPVLKLEVGSAAPSPLPSLLSVPVGAGAVVRVVRVGAEGPSVAELAGAAELLVLVAVPPPESFSRPAVMVMGMR